MASGDVNLRVSADASGLNQALQDAGAAVNSFASNSSTAIQNLGSSVSSLQGVFSSFAAILTGGAIAGALGEIVNKVGEFAERASQMKVAAETFGISTEQLQGLQQIATESGVGFENLSRTMETLESRMRTAGEMGGEMAERFNALGISTTELRDPTFTVVDAMERMGAATNSNAELLAILGPRAGGLIPIIRELASNHDAAAEAAARVNALLPSEIAALESYHRTVATASTELQNFSSRIAIQLSPALKEMLVEFQQLTAQGEPLRAIFGFIGEVMKAAAVDATGLAYAFRQVVDTIVNGARLVVAPIAGMAAALAALVHGDFAGAKSIMSDAFHDIGANYHKMIDDFNRDTEQGERAMKNMEAAVNGLDEVFVGLQKKPTDVGLLPDLSKADKLQDDMERMYDEIAKHAQQAMKDANKAILADAASSAEQQEEIQTAGLDRQLSALRAEASEHQITAKEELDQTILLLSQKWQEQQAYYTKLRTLYADDMLELDKINKQEEVAHQKYLSELQKADQTYHQQQLAQWKQLGQQITTSFASNLTGLIEGTRSFTQAVRSLFASLIDGIIQIFVRMAVQWAENMILQKVQGKIAAASQISANAGIAATAAMASVAAIPFYGWAMAPAVGATTFATALGYEGALSAEGGFDIPSGVNPVTQLHEKEMVLPSAYADVIRGFADSASSGNVGGDHFHIHAMDANSVKAFISRPENRAAFAGAIKTHFSRGGR